MSASEWKERLAGLMAPDLADEVDLFEAQIELRKQGKMEDRVFAETRLRRGAYGQRYDNGLRNDGTGTRRLAFPSGELTKGPETMWDAPGMLRIKIPYGGITPEQIEVLADLAEEYSDEILHITTRQDVQLHFIHIEETPTIMRRLAAVGITTREACGNSVRNVTGCPVAGVCRTETFDVTGYADALTRFLLGHPDCQDFGRKFKISFSGCAGEACALARMHDLGAVAAVRTVDGVEQRGFTIYVGGGLGTTPYQAKVLTEFTPVEELLPVTQAVARVFARLGEKQNRNRARIKFLVAKLGIEEFRRLVEEERAILPYDPRWTSYLPHVGRFDEEPVRPAAVLNGAPAPDGFERWLETNVYAQRQEGYAVATVALPLGDLSSWQARQLADIARRFVGDTVRTTVEQNIVLRWVSQADLPALYTALRDAGLAEAGAGTILDITSCPGTDTCKLGISASRGLAGELRERLAATAFEMDEAVRGLHIKVSGCFNSCGQHHVADIGFFGNSRKVGGHTVPHFQVVLGGKWEDNAGAYGLPIGAVPSKNIPDVVDRITSHYVARREQGESFQDFISRIGKKEMASLLEDLKKVPAYEIDRFFYSDWGDPREFSMELGIGECAGEVISRIDLELSIAESTAFESQLALDDGDLARADERAYRAMITAARALVGTEHPDVPNDPDTIVREFKQRFYDTKIFFDRFAQGKFAQPLFDRHEAPFASRGADAVRELVEEASLFIDAVHACQIRLAGATSGVV
ncbi:MAG: nitrite/sulfite reductase [Actinomycetota bacterium]